MSPRIQTPPPSFSPSFSSHAPSGMQAALNARFGVARPATRAAGARRSAVQPVRAAAATEMTDDLGFKLMRRGVKVAAKESILTPRCYGEGRLLPGAPGAPNV